MKKISLIVATISIVVACGTKKAATTPVVDNIPNQADVDRVATIFPGYTLEELNEGKKLYESNCNLCHGLKKTNSESEEEWRTIVPRMVKKANNKNGNALDASGEEKILRYVIAMSKANKTGI
jgi:cytochrome c5